MRESGGSAQTGVKGEAMTSVITAVVWGVLLNIAAATLILLRSRVYGVRLYRPMLLNVMLSFLPALLAIIGVAGLMLLVPSIQLAGASAPVLLWTYVALATLVWLLFLPNSVPHHRAEPQSPRGRPDACPALV